MVNADIVEHGSYTWYRNTYPEGPECEFPQVFTVLRAIAAPWNLRPSGAYTRKDGGFQPVYRGIRVKISHHDISTWDSNALTELVLRAHKWHCRVSLCAVMNYMEIMVTARDPHASDSRLMRGHPGLDDLIAMCEERMTT